MSERSVTARNVAMPGRPALMAVDGDSVHLPAGALVGLRTETVDTLCRDFLAAIEDAPRPVPPDWATGSPHREDGSRDGLQAGVAGIELMATWSPDEGASLFMDASLREQGVLPVAEARELAATLNRLADAVEEVRS